MDHPRPGLKYVDADDLDNSTFDFDGIDVVDQSGEKLGVVDGFIIDVNQSRPYHVVVEAGHWYKHKHFLLPIGHVRLDTGGKRLTADVSKTRAEAFPGFSRGEFEKLTDTDMDQMAYSSVQACCDDPIDRTVGFASWTHYEYPSWWDASYYRPAGTTAGGSIGSTAAAPSASRISSSGAAGAGASTASRDRERELVTARGGETSPHAGARAQPGDVIGVETGGEQTHIGDTAKDEDQRRRDVEKAAAKDRR
jgi:PRC-barrel domain protein